MNAGKVLLLAALVASQVVACQALSQLLSGAAGDEPGQDAGMWYDIGRTIAFLGGEAVALIAGGSLATWKVVEAVVTKRGRAMTRTIISPSASWRETFAAFMGLIVNYGQPPEAEATGTDEG